MPISFPLRISGHTDRWSLKTWQECFKEIFFDKNNEIKRDGFKNNRISFSRGYIISHLAQDLGALAENIREVDKTELKMKSIPAIFAWLCGFANEFGFELRIIR